MLVPRRGTQVSNVKKGVVVMAALLIMIFVYIQVLILKRRGTANLR